jgi:hypothetical protein
MPLCKHFVALILLKLTILFHGLTFFFLLRNIVHPIGSKWITDGLDVIGGLDVIYHHYQLKNAPIKANIG